MGIFDFVKYDACFLPKALDLKLETMCGRPSLLCNKKGPCTIGISRIGQVKVATSGNQWQPVVMTYGIFKQLLGNNRTIAEPASKKEINTIVLKSDCMHNSISSQNQILCFPFFWRLHRPSVLAKERFARRASTVLWTEPQDGTHLGCVWSEEAVRGNRN